MAPKRPKPADWVEDQGRDPENVQPILGLPDAVVEASGDGHGDAVVEVVAQRLHDDEADPVAEREGCVLFECEAVSAGVDGFLQPHGHESVDAHVESKRDQREQAHDDGDWAYADDEWCRCDFHLEERPLHDGDMKGHSRGVAHCVRDRGRLDDPPTEEESSEAVLQP